jgi:phage terminase small subunit
MGKITPKQLKWSARFMECGNATQAYADAYECGNMSRAAIQTEAARLVAHPAISLHLEMERQRIADESLVTVAGVVSDLYRLRDLAEASGNMSAAVRAQELIGKTIAAFTDKTETAETHEDRLEARIAAAEAEKRKVH